MFLTLQAIYLFIALQLVLISSFASNDHINKELIYILAYTRHYGTYQDNLYFMNQNIMKINFTYINSKVYYEGYGLNIKQSVKVLNDNLEIYISYVKSNDVIIISDYMPDSLPFLKLLELHPEIYEQRPTSIILQCTSQFDVYTHDFGYIPFLQKIQESKRIFWIINNPWMSVYSLFKGLVMKNPVLIRPYGYSDVEAKELGSSSSKCVLHLRSQIDPIISNIVNRNDVVTLRGQYGGPLTLAKYKCFIFVPYQVSVMKMFENINAGVITLIPSKQFMMEIYSNYSKQIPDGTMPFINRDELVQLIGTTYQWDYFVEFYK